MPSAELCLSIILVAMVALTTLMPVLSKTFEEGPGSIFSRLTTCGRLCVAAAALTTLFGAAKEYYSDISAVRHEKEAQELRDDLAAVNASLTASTKENVELRKHMDGLSANELVSANKIAAQTSTIEQQSTRIQELLVSCHKEAGGVIDALKPLITDPDAHDRLVKLQLFLATVESELLHGNFLEAMERRVTNRIQSAEEVLSRELRTKPVTEPDAVVDAFVHKVPSHPDRAGLEGFFVDVVQRAVKAPTVTAAAAPGPAPPAPAKPDPSDGAAAAQPDQ